MEAEKISGHSEASWFDLCKLHLILQKEEKPFSTG
jgi:hypothetical protein